MRLFITGRPSQIMVSVFLLFLISILSWRSINYVSGDRPGTDSGAFVAGGLFLLEGKVLYKDFWDHKPPMIHFLNATAMALCGKNFNSVRLMERCFAVFGAVSFFFIIYLIFANKLASFFASIFFIILFYRPTIFQGGNLTEEYGVVFVLGGILFILLSKKAKTNTLVLSLISGIFFAAAFFTKEPFLFSALPWLLVIILDKDSNHIDMFKHGSAFIFGAALIFAAILSYLITNDALKDWIDILSFNFVNTSKSHETLTIFARISKNYLRASNRIFETTVDLRLFALAGIISVFCLSFIRKYKYLPLVAVTSLAMDFYGTMASSRAYGHYYMQLMVPYILVSMFGVVFILHIFKKLRFIGIAVVLVFVLLSLNLDNWRYKEYKNYFIASAKKVTGDSIGEYIKANSSKKEYIWMTTGSFSKYYIETERLSPTKYFYIFDHLFVDTYFSTSEEKIENIKNDLKRNPPKFIITGIDNVETVNSSKIIDWVYENYTKLSVSEGDAILLVRKSLILNSQDKMMP